MNRDSWLFLFAVFIVEALIVFAAVGFAGMLGLILLLPASILDIWLVRSGINVVPEYDRRVIFRLGKCVGARGPGVVWVNPLFERSIPVDMRERFNEVSHEACITKDNAKIDVDFLFYWKIVNPVWSQTRIQNLDKSLEGLATGLLRAVIGLFVLDDALAQRGKINEELKDELEGVSEHWGVTVTTVEIREIVPPKDIQDAMHRQLAAERDRRALILEAQGQRENAVLRAEGEALALERLCRAAKEIDAKTLQIKYLEALTDLGKSNSTKYVFPLEFTQLIRPFVQSPSAAVDNHSSGSHTLTTEDMMDLLKVFAESMSPKPREEPVGSSAHASLPLSSDRISSSTVEARIIPPLDEQAA